MTLQDIGQAVAIIGVIVSLVYLAYEIRQNTITMRRTASMEIVRSLNDLGRYFLEYPELARLYLNMNEQPQQLNELDHFRYQLLMMNILSNFELAIDYHHDGLLSNQGLETYSQSVARLFNNPVVVEWWQSEGQELYSPKLRRLVTKHTRA